jgi:putative transposase
MPRPLRLHVPAAFYHVTLRGNHQHDIFFRPADRDLFNELTAEVIERFAARLHGYCLMSNHVHLLLQVGDTPLGRIMLRIAGRYARTIQRNLQTTGHLFEKRYHAILVDADAYLLELLRYIHLNPVRAHLVARPHDYPWSSHHAYLGTQSQPWVTTEFALRMLDTRHDKAIDAYRRFIERDVDATSPALERNHGDQRILGADDFASRVLGAPWKMPSRKTLPELLEEAARHFSVSTEALCSHSRQRHLAQARAWVARQALARRIASLSQVARLLQRDESSLRECMHRHYPT